MCTGPGLTHGLCAHHTFKPLRSLFIFLPFTFFFLNPDLDEPLIDGFSLQMCCSAMLLSPTHSSGFPHRTSQPFLVTIFLRDLWDFHPDVSPFAPVAVSFPWELYFSTGYMTFSTALHYFFLSGFIFWQLSPSLNTSFPWMCWFFHLTALFFLSAPPAPSTHSQPPFPHPPLGPARRRGGAVPLRRRVPARRGARGRGLLAAARGGRFTCSPERAPRSGGEVRECARLLPLSPRSAAGARHGAAERTATARRAGAAGAMRTGSRLLLLLVLLVLLVWGSAAVSGAAPAGGWGQQPGAPLCCLRSPTASATSGVGAEPQLSAAFPVSPFLAITINYYSL